MSDSPYRNLTTREDVEEIMSPGGGAAVIDFWGPSCGPCRMMGPHFDQVATEYADSPIQFCKVNTQSNPDLAAPFRIRSIPTLLFILDGEIIDGNVGALDSNGIGKRVETLLSKARGEGFLHRLFGVKKKPAQ